MTSEQTSLQREIENLVTNGLGFREGACITGDTTELELQRDLCNMNWKTSQTWEERAFYLKNTIYLNMEINDSGKTISIGVPRTADYYYGSLL